MKYIPHLKVYVCLYQLRQTLELKKMYALLRPIFIWNDIFQVDNESKCFLGRE